MSLGFGPRWIEERIRAGWLTPVHRGVYAVGHPSGVNLMHWMAAVLAGGDGAVLSGVAGAQLYGIRGGFRVPIAVTVPRARRPRRGIRFHRVELPPDEVTVHDGIPVTTVPRTIFDCAATSTVREVERMLNEADARRLNDPLSLLHLLDRYPVRAGSRTVRTALARRNEGATVTKGDLEEAFIVFVDEIGARRPEVNGLVHAGDRTFEVDCVWRPERLAVELDSRAFHDVPEAFETDRQRDRILILAGWTPIRVTWRMLEQDRDALACDLTSLLSAPRAA